MEISLDTGGSNLVRSYGPDRIVIGERTFRAAIVLSPEAILEDRLPRRPEELAPAHLEAVTALGPEVVLVGTGARLRFPAPEVTAPLLARGIGVEVMDTGAACRTYNVLASEGRRVVALLLLG
ncbi:Mth938-like domain-containing protein [Inmirania thermothiophila]|uniref:Mth938-like domain-containing protein n=1 Tax=Inmirania thermothiophila TaxID=1750597 RepID=A0A3N1XZT7_9GAMM|nr:Mth938-like domain-containing protein [Inmirania thermothiophila]ROR32106.1 uncharacterized protein EDC57_1297 [Inmirania thermothiophila]